MENWKKVPLENEFAGNTYLEVSTRGRLRIYNKCAPKGKLVKGSIVEGYRIYRMKLFRPRPALVFHQLDELAGRTEDWAVKKRRHIQAQDFRDRAIHKHFLFHRLVAEAFLIRPSLEHTVVAHLDYDKLNNRRDNLRWQTPAENKAHQQKSPHKIEFRPAAKLSETQVLMIKKLLAEGKREEIVAKSFPVTGTQLRRIKKGENWAAIQFKNPLNQSNAV